MEIETKEIGGMWCGFVCCQCLAVESRVIVTLNKRQSLYFCRPCYRKAPLWRFLEGEI